MDPCLAAALWKGEEAPSRKPLTSCPASFCRALDSSLLDPASEGMSASRFPVFLMQFLCGPGSVYIHNLGPMTFAAAVEVQGLGMGNGGVLPLGQAMG